MVEVASPAPLGAFRVLERGAPEEAHELAMGLMNRHRMRLRDDARRFGADIRATPARGVSLLYFGYGTATEIHADPLPDFATAMLPLRGRLEHAHGGFRGVATAGEGAFYSEGEPVHARWSADLGLLVLRVERAALARKLAALSGTPAERAVAFAPVIRSGSAIVPAIRTFAEIFDRFGPEGPPPIVAEEYEELLLSMLLLDLEHDRSDRVHGEVATPSHASMRAATRYIEEHYAEPISAAALAEAAHVSERTLYEGFRRVHGTTPMGYVRRFRLERVREALAAAEPGDGTTVADVALRHGFGHFGRFAARYRERYGESPSATLRR